MEKKTASGIMLTLPLFMLMLAFSIQPVKASGTIYIRDNGSVDPPTAPIFTVDNITYTFTADIYDSVVVERDNIVVDGAGYIVHGTGTGAGIILLGKNSVTIKNMKIKAFDFGIELLRSSDNNSICGNSITANYYSGICLDHSSNNKIHGNNITNNLSMYGPGHGIWLSYSTDNCICGNNITNNGSRGIWFDHSSNNKIHGNNVAENYNGIWLDSYSNQNSICGNNVAKHYSIYLHNRGIYLDSSSNNSVYGNNITENNRGIWLASSNNSIYGNNVANNDYGIWLSYSKSNHIYANNIANNDHGIWLHVSTKNDIHGNNIEANYRGISLYYSSNNNSIYGNNVANNDDGIYLDSSSNNFVYHNSFMNYKDQAYSYRVINVWDDGYPSGGNYWSDYKGVDANGDGIGDAPYAIYLENTDRYPLMGPLNTFDAGTWNGVNYSVDVVSNSTISDFYFNPDEGAFLRFNVTALRGTRSFCRVTVPNGLLWVEDAWTILVGNEPVEYTLIPDERFTYIYFTYSHSTKTVTIKGTYAVPEFPSTIILPLFLILTMLAIVIVKRRLPIKLTPCG